MDEVVVGELEISLPQLGPGRRSVVAFLALWIRWRDEPSFTIEDANKLLKIALAVHVTSGCAQFEVGAHGALDVGAGFGKERLEHRAGSLLMVAVFWWGI